MTYQVTPTRIPDVLVLEPRVFGDERGHFFESFNERDFWNAVGQEIRFVQDNQSRSTRNVLRGLHYQDPHPQGKLVRVLSGAVFDVAVDIRSDSPTFGAWVGLELTGENKLQLWLPPGIAHGFLVLSDIADFHYKTTDYWHPECERVIRWNDPEIGITWPLRGEPTIGQKDSTGPYSKITRNTPCT